MGSKSYSTVREQGTQSSVNQGGDDANVLSGLTTGDGSFFLNSDGGAASLNQDMSSFNISKAAVGNVSITKTDLGAIQSAFNFAQSQSGIVERAVSFVESSQKNVLDTVGGLVESVTKIKSSADLNSASVRNVALGGLVIAGLVLAVFSLKK